MDLLDSWPALRRHVPTAFAVVMLAGVALPAQAKNTDRRAPGPQAAPPAAKAPVAPPPAGQRGNAKGHSKQAARNAKPDAPSSGAPDDSPPPLVGAPRGPGKVKAPKEAARGAGRKAKAAAPDSSKGKTATAPAAQAVEAVAQPAAPPAPTPAPAPAPAPETEAAPGADDRPARSPQDSESIDETTARAGAGAGAGATAATITPPVETPALAAADAPAPSSQQAPAEERRERDTGGASAPPREDSGVTRTVREVVEVVPEPLKAALALLAALAVLAGGGYALAAVRARRLDRQRRELMQEVGLLQAALLPPVPEKVGAVRASVAYRPSDGPGAGGDFYDALTLPGGRAAFILGDVSGHGREALAHTAFMRYTLRAYLEAGLEPRLALQVAERAVGGQLDGDFATVIVAVHDPATGALTYASAGHPAPIVTGGARHEPVLAAWSPPIGWGLPTGLRQTTVPLPSGAIACLYTDGLAEATTEEGILGRSRLAEIVGEAGRDASAQNVLDAVTAEAVTVRDDMAVCLIAPVRSVSAGAFRTELLELGPSELHEGLAVRFLEECHVPDEAIAVARDDARRVVDEHGGALMVVNFGVRGSRVEVLPRNVESLQAAALKKSAAR